MRKPRIILGIDEAGRGPIIGPMMIAGVAIREDLAKDLGEKGVKDSKTLTPIERERLYNYIYELAEHLVIARIEPQLIDEANLNQIEYSTISFIIERALARLGNTITAIYIDAVGPKKKLIEKINRSTGIKTKQITVIVEERADKKYPAVSAASILAKVARDKAIEEYKKEYGEIGSGYPHDPRTINWIRKIYKENKNPPPIIRRTWSTLKKIAPKWYRPKRVLKGARKTRSILEYLNPDSSS